MACVGFKALGNDKIEWHPDNPLSISTEILVYIHIKTYLDI